jgi:hypothetical protein
VLGTFQARTLADERRAVVDQNRFGTTFPCPIRYQQEHRKIMEIFYCNIIITAEFINI